MLLELDSAAPWHVAFDRCVAVVRKIIPLLSAAALQGCFDGISSTDTTSAVIRSEFTVGGTVSGLTGSGLVLENNGGDDLPVTANGAFVFASSLISGDSYSITVLDQPGAPTQTCVVTHGTGTITTANVTSVTLSCVDKTASTDSIGGTAMGILGSGLVLQNNGGDNLAITANGPFTFASQLPAGLPYSVQVLSPPLDPYQDCVVTNGAGTTASGNVSNVSVTCKSNDNPTFTIGGTVSGVSAAAPLVLQDNGRDNLTISASGPFQFATPIPTGSSYHVTALSVGGPQSQTCAFSNTSGTVAAANVTDVAIACKPNASVSLTVSGLVGSGLVLQDNGVDSLPITSNGTHTFPAALAIGTAYNVSVASQPTGPVQTCAVSNGTGIVTAGAPTAVAVTCSTIGYSVGGSISGLVGTGLVLQDNGGNNLAPTGNGSFMFSAPLSSGSPYAVSVLTQPTSPSQTCTINGGSGTISGTVSNVGISCTTNTYTISGTATGLSGHGLILQDNGGNDTTPDASGNFQFSAPVASGSPYAVSVLTQPSAPSQTCTVTTGSGTVTTANVAVSVNCITNRYAIGGTVSGLAGTGLALQLNGGSAVAVSGDGTFVLPTPVSSGATYTVLPVQQPSLPTQVCTVNGGSGVVTAGNVTTVAVTCVTSQFELQYTVTGALPAAPTGLTISVNGGTPTAASSNTTYTVPGLLSGSTYSVAVAAEPVDYACAVTNATGPITNSNVTDVAVSCSSVGGYLYVANTGDDSISGFAIDASTAALQPLTKIVAPAGAPNAEVTTLAAGSTPSYLTSGCEFTSYANYPSVNTYGSLYVAEAGSAANEISPFSVDSSSTPGGALSAVSSPNSLGSAPVYLDANTNFNSSTSSNLCAVYSINAAVSAGSGSVSSFQENTSTGALDAISTLSTGAGVQPVAAAHLTFGSTSTTTFEYVIAQGINEILSYTVANNGGLTQAPVPGVGNNPNNFTNPLLLGASPTALATDVFSSYVCPPDGVACFYSYKPYVYVATEATGSQTSDGIQVYGVDLSSGLLTAEGSVSPGHGVGDGPTALAIVPGNSTSDLLYVANGGSVNQLTAYSVSKATGALTALGISQATGTQPVALQYALVNGSPFLFVVNQGSNSVSVFTIDRFPTNPADFGALSSVGSYAVGPAPSSIAVPYLNNTG